MTFVDGWRRGPTLVEEIAFDHHGQPIDDRVVPFLTGLGQRHRRIANLTVRREGAKATDTIVDPAARLHVLRALNLAQLLRGKVKRGASLGVNQLRMRGENPRGLTFATVAFALLRDLN